MVDWSQIVEEHGSLVWRTVHRLLSNESDAADAFQRTFVSALELSRTETIRSWPAILRRLATARVLEQLRQRYREIGRTTAGDCSTAVDAAIDGRAIDPLSRAMAAELAENLRVALAEIDSRQAEVFCLACLEDCSYADIAEQLKITANHVGVLLNRARTELRERLRAHGPEFRIRPEVLGDKR